MSRSGLADHAGYGALAITVDDRVIWTPIVEELLVRDPHTVAV